MIMVFESMMTYWKCNDINAKVKENPLYAHCMPLCVMTCGKSFKCNIMCYKCLHVRSMMTCNIENVISSVIWCYVKHVTSIWIVQVYLYIWNVMKSDESTWSKRLKRKGNWFTALVPICLYTGQLYMTIMHVLNLRASVQPPGFCSAYGLLFSLRASV